MPWPVHPNGLLGAQGDNDTYQISRSLRFNSADSAYLNRTFPVIGNASTWTFSFWIKPSSSAGGNVFSSAQTLNTNNVLAQIYFTSGRLGFFQLSVSTTFTNIITSQVFRDFSAWYHVVVRYDDTQATESNRVRMYVNGSLVTAFSSASYPSQNLSGFFNQNQPHLIGQYAGSGQAEFINGYLAEMHFVPGQSLDSSSFGETDAVTGRWKAKAFSGSYGTNGFYLKFADNSSTAALGTDSSGNGNTWTTNNFSVTAGADNDSLVDSPTNYGSDTGVGGTLMGNYATLNPLKKNSVFTLTNGNLDFSATSPASSSLYLNASIGVSSGKWYWEVTPSNVGGGPNIYIGIRSSSDSSISGTSGLIASGYAYGASGGNKIDNSSNLSYGASYADNDVIGVALNMDVGTIVFYKNNSSQGTAFSGISGSVEPCIALNVGGASRTISGSINFGQRPFAYTAPTGYKALCTTNLTTPTIKKPSSYFDAVAYTGTGASNSISSLGFSPDLVWIKNRGGATSHALYDTTRLATKQLSSDTTGDEATSSTGLTAFGSNGFTLGTSTLVNTSGTQYVAWAWDEAPIAGMDIVDYTGNGANRTIAHTLGVAPKMLIVKARTTAGADQGWPVWHTSIANTTYLQLNSTSATSTGADYWNSTSPTSSVFSVGTNAAVNTNADTYIAYAFAEVEGFSKFGSYTGNVSADGPFVYCGFRPRWVLVKRYDGGAENWILHDSARDTYNVTTNGLRPNSSLQEVSQGGIDFVSNGFKIRTNLSDVNASGASMIFAAFAEQPFKYARAR
jgi:hypothetical protein